MKKLDQPDIIPICPIYPIAIFLVVIVLSTNQTNMVCFSLYILHTWLLVVHMRAIWDIGVKYRGWQAPYTDHCAPNTQIHYPVTTKNTFDEISNGVQHSKHCIEEKGFHVFIAQKMTFLYRGRMKEWGLFSDYQPSHSRVTSDSLHLSGLGGQTDGLSLISPESVVSTHQKYPPEIPWKRLGIFIGPAIPKDCRPC